MDLVCRKTNAEYYGDALSSMHIAKRTLCEFVDKLGFEERKRLRESPHPPKVLVLVIMCTAAKHHRQGLGQKAIEMSLH